MMMQLVTISQKHDEFIKQSFNDEDKKARKAISKINQKQMKIFFNLQQQMNSVSS